jgi:hypothetical protein
MPISNAPHQGQPLWRKDMKKALTEGLISLAGAESVMPCGALNSTAMIDQIRMASRLRAASLEHDLERIKRLACQVTGQNERRLPHRVESGGNASQ